ncbi:MAG: hypothetical protein ABI378_13880 [Chitinophagaceae bacterium]
MIRNKLKVLLALIPLLIFGVSSGCYYDKQNELYPEGQCDTTGILFSKYIQPIIQSNCAIPNCHVSPNPPSGGDLSQYNGVKVIALDGRLLGSITHNAGYSPMPQSAAKLSDCTIGKFKIWVAAGALNN